MNSSIKLIIRKGKFSQNGNHTIFLQYCYTSIKRVLISTDISILEVYWDKSTGSILSSLPTEYRSAESLQDTLNKQRAKAEKIIRHAIKRNHTCPMQFLKRNFHLPDYRDVDQMEEYKLALLINLEFGVNLSPIFSASEILRQIVCFKNTLPIHPYQNIKHGYLLDFKSGESYIKLYDKGTQLKTTNVLRIEVKGMKARYFRQIQITTLQDLTTTRSAISLGNRLEQVYTKLVFTDDSIDEKSLNKTDQLFYLRMKDA